MSENLSLLLIQEECKVMLEVLSDAQGLVQCEFINKEMCVKLFHLLKEEVGKKHPEKWARNI
jgi:hypothetical protein